MSDFLNRYDLMQRLGNRTTRQQEEDEEQMEYLRQWADRKKNSHAASYTIIGWCIGLIFGMILITGIKTCIKDPQPAALSTNCRECHNSTGTPARKHRFIDYFTKAGNKHPIKMANAVMATGRPRLLAAVAVAGEKNTPYTVRKGGYKKQHAGAWQVNSKYWGRVPNDPVGQALQAERILEELTESKPIRTALSIYGGDSSSRYANRVLKELQGVPM